MSSDESDKNVVRCPGCDKIVAPQKRRRNYPRTRAYRTAEEKARDQGLYLEALSRNGASIRSVEDVPGLTYAVVQNWLSHDPEFKELYLQAKRRFGERLEGEALRRAVVGVDEPVFWKGRQVATVKKYSDRLLELVLKKANPEYREHITADVNVRGGVLIVPGVAASMSDWAEAHGAEVVDPAALPVPGAEDYDDDGASRG